MSVGQTNPLRQQMINMMYLVLTALLAMNVSAEILKAFHTVNVGMSKSIELIDAKQGQTMDQFAKLMQSSPGAVKDFAEKARQVNDICDKLYDEVEVFRKQIIDETGGMEMKNGEEHMKNDKDLEVVPRLFINEGNGDKLEKRINGTREDLIKIVKGVKEIDMDHILPSITLKVDKPLSGKTWAVESFYMVPSIAGVTLLTKIQQDIRTTQANINDALLASIGKEDFKFDKLIPVISVTTGKSAVAVGEKYEADILLAAYDSKQQPRIFLGGKELEVKDGKATFVGSTASQMSFDQQGEIVVVNKSTGTETKYPFRLAYDVFNAPAIISPTKMNVIYTNLDNPISISVPGFRPTDISATINGGATLTPVAGKPGDYIAKLPDSKNRPREVEIGVSVKLPGGGSKFVGKQMFRIKKVPNPNPYFGSKQSGEVSPGEARIVNFISVRLEDFPFDLTYRVTKFTFIFQPARGQAQAINGTGPNLTQQMKALLANPAKDDKIIIVEVFAEAPGIPNKQLPGAIVLTVK